MTPSAAPTIVPDRRPTLVCVLDFKQPENLLVRQKAFDDISRVCKDCKIALVQVDYEKLDSWSAEASVLDTMYSADIAILDMSISSQQITLSGILGSREHFGCLQNYIIYQSDMVHGLFRSNLGKICFIK